MLKNSILYFCTFCICTIQAGNLPSEAVDGKIILKSGFTYTQDGKPVKKIDKVLLKYEDCVSYVNDYKNITGISVLFSIFGIGFSVSSIILSVKGLNEQNYDYLRTGRILIIPSTCCLILSLILSITASNSLLRGIEIYNGIIKGSVTGNEIKSSSFNNNSKIFGISYSIDF